MYTLLLRLAAPLQSWGSGSYYDIRETDYYPTKSGVVGLIAAALGRKRDESLDDLTALGFGVRVDHQGERITDFQVTNMGEKLNSNLSIRRYLSDSIFLAGLESESRVKLEEIESALKNPVFTLFLGRRSCPPVFPISLGIREKGLYQALYDEEWLLPVWRWKNEFRHHSEIYLRIFVEDKAGSVASALIKDSPKSFSPFRREYEYRQVSEKKPKVINKNQIITATDHDAMKELR